MPQKNEKINFVLGTLSANFSQIWNRVSFQKTIKSALKNRSCILRSKSGYTVGTKNRYFRPI